jgi:hypothetical protein
LCSANVTYSITSDCVLEIGGEGNITEDDVQENVKGTVKTIELKGKIHTIGVTSFKGFDSLTEFRGNSHLIRIERQAFSRCTALEIISFPADSALDYIGSYAFEYCAVQTLTIPASVKFISTDSFLSCQNLTVLEMLGTPDFIDFDCLCSCVSLQEVRIPADSDKYKVIDKVLYTKNESVLLKVMPTISTFVIPTTVTVIGEYAFDSSIIDAIVIPSSIKEIRNHAFLQASNIREITVPESVKVLEPSCFVSIPNLSKLIVKPKITKVPQFFVRNCQKLETLVLPESIVYIEQFAFERCVSLKEIIIPEECEYIGISAFKNSGLAKITFPSSMITIESSAFASCGDLTEIVLPHSIDSLGINVFGQCAKLVKVTLPANIETISERCFYECPLQSIVIPESVITIGREAFFRCEKLSDVKFGSNIRTICSGAFQYSNIREAIFGSSLQNIENNAFDLCSNLDKVEFESNLNSIGRCAFRGTNISSLKILGAPRILPFAFASTSNLRSIDFGKVQKLYVYVFHSSGIEDLVIPKTITEIQNSTFRNCTNLRRVTIQGSIILEEMTFSYCNKLSEISIAGNINSISETTFNGTTKIRTLIYCGTKEVEEHVSNVAAVTVSSGYPSSTFGTVKVDVRDAACGISPTPSSSSKKKDAIIIVSVSIVAVVAIAIFVVTCCYITKKQEKREYLSESLLVKV